MPGESEPLEPAALAVASAPAHDPYAAVRDPRLRDYLAGNLLSIVGMQMEMMALRFELYDRTSDPLSIGMTGLAQVVPVLLLMLVAGHVVDQFNRKAVLLAGLATTGVAALGLAAVSHWQGPVLAVYGCLAVNGAARAFLQPAKQAFLPQLARPEHFASAVTWNSGVFHLGAVIGPALAGWLLDATRRPALIYLLNAAAVAIYSVLLLRIRPRVATIEKRELTAGSLLAGVRFVWRTEVVLGAMALDMFAVLLGGAVALLPIFAKDILQVGPRGLGWMETAPALGSVLTSLLLVHRPPLRKAGQCLLWAVAGFGVTMIVFGLSRSFALSLVVLFLSGALDNVSVVVRQTLIQLQTPDAMRGRVSAVNSMFISMSNELGSFESGLTARLFGLLAGASQGLAGENSGLAARLFGATASVVTGGVGTLAVVFAAAWKWPGLRRYDRLDALHEPTREPDGGTP